MTEDEINSSLAAQYELVNDTWDILAAHQPQRDLKTLETTAYGTPFEHMRYCAFKGCHDSKPRQWRCFEDDNKKWFTLCDKHGQWYSHLSKLKATTNEIKVTITLVESRARIHLDFISPQDVTIVATGQVELDELKRYRIQMRQLPRGTLHQPFHPAHPGSKPPAYCAFDASHTTAPQGGGQSGLIWATPEAPGWMANERCFLKNGVRRMRLCNTCGKKWRLLPDEDRLTDLSINRYLRLNEARSRPDVCEFDSSHVNTRTSGSWSCVDAFHWQRGIKAGNIYKVCSACYQHVYRLRRNGTYNEHTEDDFNRYLGYPEAYEY